jgi:hypothetical protein
MINTSRAIMSYMLNDHGTDVEFLVGARDFLFSRAPGSVLGPNQPHSQWVPGALSPRVKWLGHETNHSLLSNAEVKNAWGYNSTLPYVFMTLTLSFSPITMQPQ